MRVVYVAGPFRAANQWEQEQNIRRAEALSLEIWKLGGVALCPHLNTRYFSGALPDETWLEGDLELLRRCDAVLMVPGWSLSHGARLEMAFASDHNIQIFFVGETLTLENLKKWIAAS